MEQFFVLINPIVELVTTNFWYFLMMFALIFNKRSSLAGFAMVCGSAIWGCQTWIAVTSFIIALLSDSRDVIIYKANAKDKV